MHTSVILSNGLTYDLLNPTPVPIETIAIGLSRLDRYQGCSKVPFSVGAHSLLTSEIARYHGATKEIQLAALLHDAFELVCGDMNGVFMRVLKLSKETKDRWALMEEMFMKNITPVGCPMLDVSKYDRLALVAEIPLVHKQTKEVVDMLEKLEQPDNRSLGFTKLLLQMNRKGVREMFLDRYNELVHAF